MNTKSLSPLLAKILLVIFSLIVGIITMNWGKSYVDRLATEDVIPQQTPILIDAKAVDSDLKRLQISYIEGDITLEEYLKREKQVLEKEKQ